MRCGDPGGAEETQTWDNNVGLGGLGGAPGSPDRGGACGSDVNGETGVKDGPG